MDPDDRCNSAKVTSSCVSQWDAKNPQSSILLNSGSFQETLSFSWLWVISFTCFSHHTWILASSVSSGWKLVPKTLPCLTAVISPASSSKPIAATLSPSLRLRPGKVAMISTGRKIRSLISRSGLREGAMIVLSIAASSTCSPFKTGNIFSTTGALMKIPLNGLTSSVPEFVPRKGRSSSAWKLSVCLPK